MDQFINKALQHSPSTLILVAGKKPTIKTAKGLDHLSQGPVKGEDLLSFVKKMLKEKIQDLQKGLVVKGSYDLSGHGAVPYQVTFKNKILTLYFICQSGKPTQEDLKTLKSKNPLNQEALDDKETSPEKVKGKEDGDKNHSVVISDSNNHINKIKDYCQKENVIFAQVAKFDELSSVISSGKVRLIFLDEKVPEYTKFLKYFYDMPFEQRKNILLLLLSSQFKQKDVKQAFSLSVDYIFDRDAFDNIEEIIKRPIKQSQSLFSLYENLKKEID